MAFSIDASKKLSTKVSQKADNLTSATNGTGVQVQGYEAVLLIADIGTLTTGPTADVRWEEGDTLGGSYTAIAAADLSGGALPQITTSNDEQQHIRAYLGSKKFVRFALTAIAGGSLDVSAHVVRSIANREPVTQG